jgi:hypothetical protein
MRKHLRKIRGGKVTKREVASDAIFLAISAIISLIIIFLFDIHRSFYEWPPKLQFIFNSPYPYIIFTAIGMFIGFFIIKLLLLGVKEKR